MNRARFRHCVLSRSQPLSQHRRSDKYGPTRVERGRKIRALVGIGSRFWESTKGGESASLLSIGPPPALGVLAALAPTARPNHEVANELADVPFDPAAFRVKDAHFCFTLT
jgi:hypothetical protein